MPEKKPTAKKTTPKKAATPKKKEAQLKITERVQNRNFPIRSSQ